MQRYKRSTVKYLPVEDLKIILAQPDLNTPEGRRDVVLLSLLYDTGARVQEIIDISVRDIRLETPAQATLHGKGNKARAVPLMKPTVHLVKEYLQEHQLDKPENLEKALFSNRYGSRLSRSGVRYILQKYTSQAKVYNPQLLENISPHVLRHTPKQCT
jgi:site-specific recombinase XerD